VPASPAHCCAEERAALGQFAATERRARTPPPSGGLPRAAAHAPPAPPGAHAAATLQADRGPTMVPARTLPGAQQRPPDAWESPLRAPAPRSTAGTPAGSSPEGTPPGPGRTPSSVAYPPAQPLSALRAPAGWVPGSAGGRASRLRPPAGSALGSNNSQSLRALRRYAGVHMVLFKSSERALSVAPKRRGADHEWCTCGWRTLNTQPWSQKERSKLCVLPGHMRFKAAGSAHASSPL